MSKRIFIIHRWDATPEADWYPWLKSQLELRGFSVEVPVMPNPESPTIDEWVGYLQEVVGEVDTNTFFVGHSIGCQTILRFLEQLPEGECAGGAVFVAGWFALKNLESPEVEEIAKPWEEIPIDFEKVKRHLKQCSAILSKNDEFVSLPENKYVFEQMLGANVVVEEDKGHMTGEEGVTELTSARDALLEMMI